MGILDGKRALVGGGSRGIGLACAEELARLGASVTVLARNAEALKKIVAELPATAGQRHNHIAVDFTDRDALRSGVTQHIESTGPIHILINNTGGPPAGPVGEADESALTDAFSNHLLCNQLLVQALVPGMKEAKYGRIVNVISTSVIQPVMGLGVSNTIRGAVANWGRTLAGELAPFGITVNNVLPGYTSTDRLRSILRGRAEKQGVAYEDIERDVMASVPMGRFADPAEFAAVVGFLASPAASYVTGVNLPVDGGRTAVQ